MVYLLTNCINEALHAVPDTVRANSSVGSTAHLPMPEVGYCQMGPKCTAVVVYCMRILLHVMMPAAPSWAPPVFVTGTKHDLKRALAKTMHSSSRLPSSGQAIAEGHHVTLFVGNEAVSSCTQTQNVYHTAGLHVPLVLGALPFWD